ncbi:MAG: hypothetical protein KDB07_04015, partial [Planctomycetes bacterium]|nr:hypothetical protein [Planctomycetota bacterium]
MFQPHEYAVKGTARSVLMAMYDGAGAALAGLVSTDLRVTLLKHDGTAFDGKSLVAADWTEVGSGLYRLALDEDDLDTSGYLVVRITPDPGYVGTMRQSTRIVWVADEEGLDGGLILDRPAWVPVCFSLAGVPVGGITDVDLTLSQYLGPGDTAYTALALTSGTDFREILDGVDTTGVYQVLLPYTVFDETGLLVVELESALFDAFSEDYPVVKANTRRVIVTVKDDEALPVSGITIYATDTVTGLVSSTRITDSLGQVVFDLQDGSYILTLQQGSAIFMENNVSIDVQDPDVTPQLATAASVTSGNAGPFTLAA